MSLQDGFLWKGKQAQPLTDWNYECKCVLTAWQNAQKIVFFNTFIFFFFKFTIWSYLLENAGLLLWCLMAPVVHLVSILIHISLNTDLKHFRRKKKKNK